MEAVLTVPQHTVLLQEVNPTIAHLHGAVILLQADHLNRTAPLAAPTVRQVVLLREVTVHRQVDHRAVEVVQPVLHPEVQDNFNLTLIV